MPPATCTFIPRFPTLREFGIAAQFHRGYVHHSPGPHGIDAVLCSFVVRGRGRHQIGDTLHREQPGCLSITHYGEVHDIITETPMDIINLFLDPQRHALPQLSSGLLPALEAFLPLHPSFHNRCNRCVHLQLQPPDPAAALLMQLTAETSYKHPGQRENMEHLLAAFLILCCRQVLKSGVQIAEPPPEGGLIESVRRYLDQHPAEPHNLTALARMARMTPPSLARAFKRSTGKSAINYLHQRRIESAAFQLKYTTDKIVAIAIDCGFGDISFFNRKFRELMNCTPAQYRAQFRG